MNLRALGAGCVVFAVLVAIFLFAALGDLLVVVLLVCGLAGVRVGSPAPRAAAVLLLAFAIEGFQSLKLVKPGTHWFLDATLGSTFDPLDLLMYAIGAAIAYGLDRTLLSDDA